MEVILSMLHWIVSDGIVSVLCVLSFRVFVVVLCGILLPVMGNSNV